MAQVRGGTADKSNLALGLGVAAALAWVAGAMFTGESGDDNGWIWTLMAVLALGAVITGFMARQAGKFPRKALAGVVLGGLLVLVYAGFWAVELMG